VRADNAWQDQWIVTNGLKAGDRVIVSGLQKVRAGVAVHVAVDSAVPASASVAAASSAAAS
jgi:membrane fusion protein, multidrug efflux system